MSNKTENFLKLLVGLIGLLIATSCTKDTVHESINQVTELRDNTTLKDYFKGSNTIYDYETQTQIIINSDSLNDISFVRANQKTVGKTHPVTGVEYVAGVWRIIFHFKSNTDLSGVYYMQDTTANTFNISVFKATIKSDKSFITYVKKDEYQSYYDHRAQKSKRRYLYSIDGRPPEYLQSWHHPSSSVFFLDHKN